jgi:hypothetical protein
METFFILLAIVFVPFIWFIIRMLRYTDETIGENSPLYKTRMYQVSAWDYFVKFDKVGWAVCAIMMLTLSKIMIDVAVNQEPLAWLFVLTFAAASVLFGSFFYVDWQYWSITRHVAITLDPTQPSIIVDSPTTYSVLTPQNVTHIEHHLKKSSNSKDPLGGYGYFLFYTESGQAVQVNNNFFVHIEFLERFFKYIPSTVVMHRMPWPNTIPLSENQERSNFDTPNQR